MSRTILTIEQILTILAETPPCLAGLAAGLTESQLQAAPGSGEWSVNAVLAHLRSCADVWGNCIVAILDQDHPTIRAVNPTTWIQATDYLEQGFRPSLRAFTVQRENLLKVLRPLKAAGWSRSANVTGAGKALELTVQSYAQRMARHERPHVKQIMRAASAVRQDR